MNRDIAIVDSLYGQSAKHGCQGSGVDVLG